MAGKYSIFEPKKGCSLGARDLLFAFAAVLLAGCFIEPDGRMRLDGGVEDKGTWPPEVMMMTPAEPISDFELAPGTKNCLFPIRVMLRDRDSDALDLRVVTDNHKSYRRRPESRRITLADGEALEEFVVPYGSFGPIADPSSVEQHSISFFVTDALDAWTIPDNETAIVASGTDLGGINSDADGDVIELRWTLVFKDGCCPEDLQEGDVVPCDP